MKTLKSLTNGNSIILILCFFLPFIVPMCSEEKTESNSVDSTSTATSSYEISDSISTNDTLASKSDSLDSKDSISTNSKMEEDKGKEEENRFINFIMMPDGKNVSGIGFMFHYTLFGISIVSLPVSFILILLTFMIRRWNLKFTLFALGFLSFVCFGVLNRKEIVYGYWVTLVFYVNAVFLHWRMKIKEMSS